MVRMSPEKMIVAKVVSHKDFERQVLMSIEEFSLFEFIDVRRQAGLVDVKRTRDEETVYSALERLTKVLESLGIDQAKRTGFYTDVDDTTLENSLTLASEVISAVEEEVLDIDSKTTIARLEIERQRGIADVAVSLKPLGIDPSLIGTTEFTFTTAGIVPAGRESELEWSIGEVTDGAFTIGTLRLKRGGSACVVTVPVDMKEAVERILSAMQFEAFAIPEDSAGRPEQIVADAEVKISELEEELDQLEKRKDHIALEWGTRILAAWETLDIERKRVDIKSYIVYTDQAIKMWGWIPEGREEELEALLRENVGPALEVTFDKPDFAEVEAPTYISNPSYMKPAEDVVKAFGIPSRHDLDPTKFMAWSFPLIFGLVFADVGQGFLIFLIGYAAYRANKKGQDWGAILGYVQNGAQGLMMMGIFAIMGGFLFGSFFGAETVIEPLWPIFAHTDPNRATHMLKLSIEVGAIHISLGIVLALYNELKYKHMRKALINLSYLIMYLGFIILIFGVSYNSVGNWFLTSGTVSLWIPIIGIGYGTGTHNPFYPVLPIAPLTFTLMMFIIPLVIMLLASFKGGMDGIVHLLESVIGMISHTVSYARIFALNTVHIILSGVFITLLPPIVNIYFPPFSLFGVDIIPEVVHTAHYTGPPVMPILGAFIGTLIVGILEGLLGFMHTLRLHFVEWFSKFYHAGGVEFQPFYVKRLHTVKTTQQAVAANITTS
ncbi:MAG: V-type ATPase 116kDa subunit family protein [Candidatus Thorarchaeota archaeon]